MPFSFKLVLLFLQTLLLIAEANADDNKSECVNQVIRWCQNKDYSHQRSVNSATTAYNPVVGKSQMIRCASNQYGSNCMKDNEPWLYCSSNKEVKYKDVVLQPNSLTGADSEICFTANKTEKDDFLGTVDSAHMPGLEEAMKGIMKIARRSMNSAEKDIFKPCFPFCF